MKILFTIMFSFILFTVVSLAQEKYGKEISLDKKTEITQILSNPSDYVGKKVLVEGEVIAVCKMAGCWMEIANEDGKKMRVKVKDGEIVFPQEAIGKSALVEGEVYSIELDEEQAKEFYEHMAEEGGSKFDVSTIKGHVTIYQIKGIGALIN